MRLSPGSKIKFNLPELHRFLHKDIEYVVIKREDLENIASCLTDELCDECYEKYNTGRLI